MLKQILKTNVEVKRLLMNSILRQKQQNKRKMLPRLFVKIHLHPYWTKPVKPHKMILQMINWVLMLNHLKKKVKLLRKIYNIFDYISASSQ